METRQLGVAGRTAAFFLANELTPLLAVVGLLLGAFAIAVTPREEEPQIDVTFANVFIGFPGAGAREVERLVATPAEQIAAEIDGVKHVYSVSRPGGAVLTVEFEVGERRTEAIVRLYNAFYSNQDWLPAGIGVTPPLIKPMGIDDVPIVTLTLWSADPAWDAEALLRVARTAEAELQRVPGTRDIYAIGGPERVVRVRIDPRRLAGAGLDLAGVGRALAGANVATDAGALVADDRETLVRAGTLLAGPEEAAGLVVGVHGGRPVYLGDVADVALEPDLPRRYVWFGTGPAAAAKGIAARGEFPAVTLAVAKKPGRNAADVAAAVIARFAELRGSAVPDGVEATVTRDYGATASAKARTLMQKLAFATLSVVLLVLFALGRREAAAVGVAVAVTLAVTLFASWAWGFTLNRVSLFALIFSIGILVDDAIVVVENIHRHLHHGAALHEAVPRAVDEVGGPTILATFTVIAALLPMAFVSGLMGPYMGPIPINASLGMLISLLVAFTLTPWLALRLFRRAAARAASPAESRLDARLHALAERWMAPLLRGPAARTRRHRLYAALLASIAVSLALVAGRLVVLKMLPFDDKSELQVLVDLPEGASLERTAAALDALAAELARVPEVTDYQAYAGTASPINFNGLVRQYYLRDGAHLGDLQVNLVARHARDRASHDIARAVREPLQAAGRRHGANVKIVEVPPGPPVMAPLVAEIYGPEYGGQIEAARAVRAVLEGIVDAVDVDDTVEAPQRELTLRVDRPRAARLGVEQAAVAAAAAAALGGRDATWLHVPGAKRPVPVRLGFDTADRAGIDALLALKLRSTAGALVPLAAFVAVEEGVREPSIHHKDLLPVVYVTGDAAGALDSPLYAMFAARAALDAEPPAGVGRVAQHLTRQPDEPYRRSLKWDGEWQITFETFRDMGLAYTVGLALIYLLVVAQFRSYAVPLIIMAPIPLTVIGVLPGHALLGAQFTATSMIGMIALAGIIVRNSILLVDFVDQEIARGTALDAAVIGASAVRARPIALTAAAAMLGALFILDDPIFSGLAVALLFGMLVSTALTLVVIPVGYFAYRRRVSDAARAGG